VRYGVKGLLGAIYRPGDRENWEGWDSNTLSFSNPDEQLIGGLSGSYLCQETGYHAWFVETDSTRVYWRLLSEGVDTGEKTDGFRSADVWMIMGYRYAFRVIITRPISVAHLTLSIIPPSGVPTFERDHFEQAEVNGCNDVNFVREFDCQIAPTPTQPRSPSVTRTESAVPGDVNLSTDSDTEAVVVVVPTATVDVTVRYQARALTDASGKVNIMLGVIPGAAILGVLVAGVVISVFCAYRRTRDTRILAIDDA
jgi:hypothetical protein